MAKEHVPQVHALLAEYLKKFIIYPILTEERLAHMFLPREDTVYTYVVLNSENEITDFISFYLVDYSVLKHETIKQIKVTVPQP